MAVDWSISRSNSIACRKARVRSRTRARFKTMLVVLFLAWGNPSDRALPAIEARALHSQAQAAQARQSQAQQFQAWEPQSRAGASREDNANRNLEEIIVTAPRSLSSLRAEIDQVQDRAFALFNELNIDNDYDIVCRRETPLGSHIPQRVCRSRYVDRLEAEAGQEFFFGGEFIDPTADIMYHEDIMKQKLASLAQEHPDFHKALEEFYQLKTAYEEERRERFRNSWFAR